MEGDGFTAVLLDGGGRVQPSSLVAAVGQDDSGSALGDLDGGALPDAGAGARDDGDLHDGYSSCERVHSLRYLH